MQHPALVARNESEHDMRVNLLALLLSGVLALAHAQTLRAAEDDRIVPTREEAHHVGKLENQTVRIVDVEIPAGDRTLFHEHAVDYAYVMIADAKLSNEVWGKPAKDITIRSGDVGYYRSAQGPYIHRFSNVGETSFRAIGIERLAPLTPTPAAEPLPQGSGYVPVLDNERVRGYRLVLEPGERAQLAALRGPSVRVVVGGGEIEQTTDGGTAERVELQAAAFEYREKAVNIAIKNVGKSRIEMVEFEIR